MANPAPVSFRYDHDDEASGVRPIPVLEVDIVIEADGREPACAFALITGRARVFLGVSFAEGVIVSPDWRIEMRRAGASTRAIEQCGRWLRLHDLCDHRP